MKRSTKYAIGMMIGILGINQAWAGEASSNATASGGRLIGGGTAAANANYTGDDDGQGFAKTRTRSTDKFNLAKGWAIGVDRDGLDFSFSHAIAGKRGPAFASTFNLSIGRDGSVSGSYGNVLAKGGVARDVQAGGVTRSGGGATGMANASGNTVGGGTVKARTDSVNRPGWLVRAR